MELNDGVNMQQFNTIPTPAAETLMGQMIKSEERVFPSPMHSAYTIDGKKAKKTVDYTDPFVIRNLVQRIDSPKYGSVTKEIEDLFQLRKQVLMPFFKRFPSLRSDLMETNSLVPNANSGRDHVMLVDSVCRDTNAPSTDIIAIPDDDDDDEEPTLGRPFQPYRDIVLNKPEGEFSMKQFLESDYAPGRYSGGGGGGGGFSGASVGGGGRSKGGGGRGRGRGTGKVGKEKEGKSAEGGQTTTVVESTNKEDKNADGDVEVEKKHDKGEYVGVSDSDMEENDDVNFDGLADIWNEMHVGLELTKDADMDLSKNKDEEDDKECDHSYIFRDDIGHVCRVCGVVDKSIESIIEFQRPKIAKSTRTYHNEGKDRSLDTSGANLDGVKLPGSDFAVGDVSAHPRHKKQMKPHQIEGFNFLLNNLVCENPGGCILAHAPGSGKTFMLISFIQSFMAKFPDARPLVVLPKGILETWRKEFKIWQVEDIPLFDCYTTKADNRAQQFEVLKKWANQRSILLIGYKLFSTIVCDNDRSMVSASCQEILLKVPSLLILDEGHTPRNQDTDQLTSLEKVQTPRKVVLSGTLYQNHVREVFNILNLVRPKFLRMEDSKMIKRRILSRVPMESRKYLTKRTTDNEFFELVEETLLKDENFKRKVTVINDLREMTSKVLHYYKGDFLDELPGHMDFSVFLNLSYRQKREVHDLKKFTRKFKRSSDGSAIYVHPDLKSITRTTKDKSDDYIPKINQLLETLNEREGAKAKFYLNLLRLCSTTGEKLLVFCNYLIPLRFLMRLTMKLKGWSLNKEIFVITGDTDNEEREIAMEKFNNSEDAKVFFGSTKACSEGISLVGASRIIIMDVHLNPSVTRQAIGRAFRPGQVRKLYTYRLIAANSPEEEDHVTCFRKESIAKMWFEWNEYCGHNEFEMERVDVKDCGDEFLETPWLNEDVTALFKRS
nr:protein chromatin remodeling 35-like [Tanacetum cinerariifolium]